MCNPTLGECLIAFSPRRLRAPSCVATHAWVRYARPRPVGVGARAPLRILSDALGLDLTENRARDIDGVDHMNAHGDGGDWTAGGT